jgi:Tol biopolymer transport system component
LVDARGEHAATRLLSAEDLLVCQAGGGPQMNADVLKRSYLQDGDRSHDTGRPAMKRFGNVVSLAVFFGLVSSCLPHTDENLSDTGTGSSQADSERIVYASYRPAGWDLYYYEYPGEGPTRLTDHPALDYDASFSPDGRWVVFTSERMGHPSLFVLDIEARGEPRLLIRSDAMEDQASISPDGRWIAFVSTAGGDADIYKLPFRPGETLDIGEAVNLTQHPGGDFRPAFSPDGNWIAFSSDRHTPPFVHHRFPFVQQRAGDIHLVPAAGGEAIRLTQAEGWDGSPAWSVDGETIYFYSEREQPGEYRLWAMHRDGANQRPIVTAPSVPALAPTVLSDGRVAFTTWEGDVSSRRFRIATIDLATSQTSAFSDPSKNCLSPASHPAKAAVICHGAPEMERQIGPFPGPLLVAGAPEILSLDGRPVALYGMRHLFAVPPHPHRNEVVARVGPLDLVRARMDGSHPVPLLNANAFDAARPGDQIFNLRWSPDGERIAFTVGPFFGGPDAEASIWMIKADGTGLRNITSGSPSNNGFAEFGPDGRLVFRSSRNGTFDIFIMDSIGGPIRNLTNHAAKDVFPAFSPEGDRIAFASDRDHSMRLPGGVSTVDLYTLDLHPDGSTGDLRRITRTPAQKGHVQFSPDGQWLIYTSGRHGINDEEPLAGGAMRTCPNRSSGRCFRRGAPGPCN